MLETPRSVLRIGEIPGNEPAPAQPAASQPRAEKILNDLRNNSGLSIPAGFRVRVLEEPPPHSGFGSGTQLALALARCLFHLSSQPNMSARDLAPLVGRGLRSAVGVHGFDLGGLIVDAGKLPGEQLGALAARVPFPDDWRFLLIRPADGHGLMGEAESAAFRDLPSFSDALTDRLSRLLLTEILPAAQARRFNEFAGALQEYGQHVGAAFAPCQGGVVHRASLPIWKSLQSRHQLGVAQTSWGPTLALACPSESEAIHQAALIRKDFPQTHLTITRGKNTPAELTP